MKKTPILILVLVIFLSCCGVTEEPEIIETFHEPEKPQKYLLFRLMETPEPIEEIGDGWVEPLEAMAGAIPDEYLETPEEQYAEPEIIVEEYYQEPVVQVTYPYYTPHDLMYHGVLYWGGWRWTWYSERVLPGPGLSIPGRWSDGDFVRDVDGCICLASSDLAWGTYVDTPWGLGRVYDCGCASGTLDVYVSW